MSNSAVPKLTISHKFSRTKVGDLLSRGQAVFTGMIAAAEIFTTPPVPLAILKQNLDNLTASSAAALDGAKTVIAQRNRDRHVLEQELTLLGAYAVRVSDGDPVVLASSGFAPAPPRTRSAPQPLDAPSVRLIEQGISGELRVSVTPRARAHNYEVRYAALVDGTPGPWTTVTFTAARKPVTISGLTPGMIYAFQTRALGKLGFTDWSDSATRMSI